MKKFLFFYKSLFRWLTLSVFLFGSMFTAQTVKAASPCSGNIHLNTIAADETWCASPDATHYITDNVTVLAGVTLTIEPGVTVVSGYDDFWKYLIIQGHLDVLGTADQPVVMKRHITTEPNLPWGGIYFDGSAGDGSGDINYATIEESGANLWPSGFSDGYTQTAVLVKNLTAGKQVNISHSTIRNNVSRGLFVVNSTVNVTDTTFSQNIYPILIEGADSVVTYSGNTFSDNAYPYYDNAGYTIQEDSIFIIEDALTGQNFTLPAQIGLEAYVWWGNTTIPAGVTMSVEPGVTLRKEGSHFLTVQGHLEAIGTPALPIRFTGMPGSDPALIHNWGGLYFDGANGDGSGNLTYATIEVGGNNYSPPACVGAACAPQNAVFVKDLPTNKQVNLSHSRIEKSLVRGVYVVNSVVNVTDTTFSKNPYPIWIEGAASVVSYSGNNFVDNTFGYVYGQPNVNYPIPLNAIAINPNALMDHNFSLPAQTGLDAYVFWDGTTIPAGRTMTVEPGVTLLTGGNKHIIVQGHLEAAGTPALPIRFSGIPSYFDPAIIDTWGGLIFDGPSGASGHLDHAIVELGGEWWNDNLTTLMIYKLAADKSVVVEHSIVQNSKFVDLAVIDSPTAQVDNNLIKGGNTGIYLATNMIVNNLAVTNQVFDGVYVESGYTAEARHLTIARTGRYGFYVSTGGTGLLKNSILSQNTLAVMAEGNGQASLDTNLADANTTFSSGAVTELNTINGSADFEADGYHIQTTSDAIGEGLPGLSVVDMDGNVRPSPAGSLPDLGADEVTQDEYNLTVLKIGSGSVTSSPIGITCGTDCSQYYNYNTTVTLTATAATGSVFTGWSGAGCSGTATCVVAMTAARSVTATFANTYLLTVIKAGNGSGSVTSVPTGITCGSDCSQYYNLNTTVTLTATPAIGSVFTGWSGACTGTGSCVVHMTAVRSVIATFTLRTYLLTVTKAGTGTGAVTSIPTGITCGTDCSQIYNYNTTVTLTATPAVGAAFTGWSGACTGTGSCVVSMTAVRSVTATFTKTYLLTVSRAGTGTGTITSIPTGIACGADCSQYYNVNTTVTLTATPAVGSIFSGWSGACTGTGSCIVSMTAAKSVIATFTLRTYLLTVTKAGTGGGVVTSSPIGIACGTDCSQIYNYNTAVTLTATPATGSIFTGWSGACTGTGSCVVAMTAAKSVTATFTLRTYLLTVTKAGTGIGMVSSIPIGITCGTDCTQPYNYNTTVTLTATPSAGSVFSGWSGACTGTGSCVVHMTTVKSVTAIFTKTYLLTVARAGTGSGTVSSIPIGITCGTDCSQIYNVNTTVTLTATPATGSIFTGWSGACTGTGSCVVAMTAAKSVTATFTLRTYLLTVSKAGTGAGTITSSPIGITCGIDCTQPYNYNTTVTLTATPAIGSVFTGWSGACTGTGSCVVAMTAAKSVTATFTLRTYLLTVSKAGTGSGTVTSSPIGITCGTDCSQSYNYNTTVTLTATRAVGSRFTGWSGACTGTSTCVVAMTAAKSVTATFASP